MQMLSFLLGLMATSVMGIPQSTPDCPPAPEDLLPCGNAFYVASQYTCYDSDKLCPVLNGQATQPCGEDCYLPDAYSCDNGVLAPPTPSIDGTFLVIALQSPYFESAFVQAAGLIFILGGAPATYCPDEVASQGACPPGTDTVWTCGSGYCSLNVQVPGGQQIYVAPNGAVGYTQAHSGTAPPGSQFSGFSLSDGELLFNGASFFALPPADNSSYPQLYASALLTQDDGAGYPIKLVTASGNQPGFSAWQYT